MAREQLIEFFLNCPLALPLTPLPPNISLSRAAAAPFFCSGSLKVCVYVTGTCARVLRGWITNQNDPPRTIVQLITHDRAAPRVESSLAHLSYLWNQWNVMSIAH